MKKSFIFLAAATLAAMTACSDDDTTTNGPGNTTPTGDGGTSPGAANGGFQVTVSGEDLAVVGYDWAADGLALGDPPVFADGWEVKFEHTIVTVANVHLNEDPDRDDGDPKQQGAVVASEAGPWAVDATIGGNIVGKSGEPDEKTVAITSFATKSDGTAFDPTQRYAFNYDLVAASASAKPVNLDAAGQALYATAVTQGYSMIYQGTATYKGPAPAAGTVFAKIPSEVHFTLGFKSPASYLNCQNTDLGQLAGSDEFPRGVQAKANETVTAQITVHTDHAFWSVLNEEGTELHFDPIAARASTYGTVGAPRGEVTMADLETNDFTAFTTKTNEPLPARSFASDYPAPAGQLSFNPNGTTFTSANPNSYASYLQYSAASGGHLNADGECTVELKYTP